MRKPGKTTVLAMALHMATLASSIAAVAGTTVSADGVFSVAGIFSDHMVLQRERPVPVWGSADNVPASRRNVALWGNGESVPYSGTALDIRVRQGRNRIILRADMVVIGTATDALYLSIEDLDRRLK